MKKKKEKKGCPGYIAYLKKQLLLVSLAEFAGAFCVLGFGYAVTGHIKNIYTVLCAVGALPASMMLTEYIAVSGCRGVSDEEYEAIKSVTFSSAVIYDLILTCRDKIMPMKSLVIGDTLICGFADAPVCDEKSLEDYIGRLCADSCGVGVTVRVFKDYYEFIRQAETMRSHSEREESKKDHDRELAHVILNVSL